MDFSRLLALFFIKVLTCTSNDGKSRWTHSDDRDFCTKNDCLDTDVKYDKVTKLLHLIKDGSSIMAITIPTISEYVREPKPCFSPSSKTDLCLSWDQNIILDVRKTTLKDLQCFNINFRTEVGRIWPEHCFSLNDAKWYGGAEFHNQRWPFNEVKIPMRTYVSQDLVVKTEHFGNVLEPYWINSNGIGIFVEDTTPLHVSINENIDNFMCLKAKYEDPHQPRRQSEHALLNYTVCKGDNVLHVHKSLHGVLFDRPDGIPDILMMKSPIWSTWARYKTEINQSKVLQFASEITKHGFSNSQIEIDDMYSSKYGDFDFDMEKFPDPAQMIQALKEKGFRTTVWVTPFANLDSLAFLEGAKEGYWLKDTTGQVPALVKWWQGIGGILDITNQKAAEWFVARLNEMKSEYMIESFKFDAGEMTFLPSSYKTTLPLGNPGFFTTQYVDTVSRLGGAIEVRCGYKSQRHPVFVRMADKMSIWGYENGLRTLIPTVLTLGILGYPYILPDMIGGNGYGETFSLDTVLPERELYIRWLEVTAYLPAMQFSFVPWDYDDEVVQIAQKMVKIHESLVTPILLRAAKEAETKGYPLIRPLWWIDPNDVTAQNCDSQFLIGEELMVAPIVIAKARSRDIYLPRGTWHDELKDDDIKGPQLLKDYVIQLGKVATFKLTQFRKKQ